MKIRNTVPLLILIGFGGISPAIADCCSSWLDCAAAVVTDGLSCEIETIISTIKTLVSLANNMLSDIDGQTQNAENGARQSVTDAYNSMQSQSQQASADLSGAQTQATQLFQEESAIVAVQAKTTASASVTQATSLAGGSSPGPNTNLAMVGHNQNMQAAAPSAPTQSGLQMHAVTAQRTTAVAPTQGSSTAGNPMQKSTVAPTTQDAVSIESQKAPHGEYADAFSRGLKFITTLNGNGTADLAQVNQYLANAMASEGAGITAADIIGNAMNAPLKGIQSELSSMLSNPLSAFDPSNAVDSMENSITASLSTNISTIVNDITAGPTQAFNAAGPSLDDLLQSAEKAQAVAAAMTQLYKLRTQGAANTLYALLPKQDFRGQIAKAVASGQIAAGFGQRMSFAKVSANFAASKQKLIVAVRPLNVAPIHAAVAQFKAQRAQGKTAQTPSMLATYRANSTQQLDSYFTGKPPAAVASARDQLIAQARSKFSNDSKTQTGVIALINSEAQKQGATASVAVTGVAASSVKTPIGLAPVAAASPKAAPTAPTSAFTAKLPSAIPVTTPAAPTIAPSFGVAPVQQKSAWGTTPAWTPPTATATAAGTSPVATTPPAAPHVVTAIKPSPAVLKTIQPIQKPVQQPTAVQALQPMPSNQ